jgi:hypothetical protein
MRFVKSLLLTLFCLCQSSMAQTPDQPFGSEFPKLDSLSVGSWWTKEAKGANPPPTDECAARSD